jgi:membrane protein DedA with SNARE-associated domain
VIGFYSWVACGALAAGLIGYTIGRIHGEDRAHAERQTAWQNAEARRRGVALLDEGRRR